MYHRATEVYALTQLLCLEAELSSGIAQTIEVQPLEGLRTSRGVIALNLRGLSCIFAITPNTCLPTFPMDPLGPGCNPTGKSASFVAKLFMIWPIL